MALEQTTLFDALLGGAPCDNPVKEGSASRQAQHLWQEVPQARFLSWSDARQRAYCALRDKDSMTFDPEHADFYLNRARGYEEQ